jgi:hypothetical protein
MDDLPSPSTMVTVTRVCSPTSRLHVIEYDASRVAVITVFSTINGPVVPTMNRVKGLTIGTKPRLWVSTTSMFEGLHNDPRSPLENRLLHIIFLPCLWHGERYINVPFVIRTCSIADLKSADRRPS